MDGIRKIKFRKADAIPECLVVDDADRSGFHNGPQGRASLNIPVVISVRF